MQNSAILIAHNSSVSMGRHARDNLMSVEIKTFTFYFGSKLLSTENAGLLPIPKLLLFTKVKNRFYRFVAQQPIEISTLRYQRFFAVCEREQFPNDSVSLGMVHEKTSAIGYRTLFEASGIHHSNSGLQITHEIYKRLFHVSL